MKIEFGSKIRLLFFVFFLALFTACTGPGVRSAETPVAERSETVAVTGPSLPPDPVGPRFVVSPGLPYDPLLPTADGPELNEAISQSLDSSSARIRALAEEKKDLRSTEDDQTLDRQIGYLWARRDEVKTEADEYRRVPNERERIELIEAVNDLRRSLALLDQIVK